MADSVTSPPLATTTLPLRISATVSSATSLLTPAPAPASAPADPVVLCPTETAPPTDTAKIFAVSVAVN